MNGLLGLLLIAQQIVAPMSVDITACGAVGNDNCSTNNNLAIKKCMDLAAGGEVGFPCGCFMVDYIPGNTIGDPIVQIPSGTKVKGVNRDCSILTLPPDFDNKHDQHPANGALDDDHRIIGALVRSSDPTRDNISIEDLNIKGGFDASDTCRKTAESSFGIFFYASVPKLSNESLANKIPGNKWTNFIGTGTFGSGRPFVARINDSDNDGQLNVALRVTGIGREGFIITEDTTVLNTLTDPHYMSLEEITWINEVELLSISGYEPGDSITITVGEPIRGTNIRRVISGEGGDPVYLGLGVVDTTVSETIFNLYCRGGFTQGGAWSNPPRNNVVTLSTFKGHPSSKKFRSVDIETGSGPAIGIRIVNNELDADLEPGRCNDCKIINNRIRGCVPASDNIGLLLQDNIITCTDPGEDAAVMLNGKAEDTKLDNNKIYLILSSSTIGPKNGIHIFAAATGSPHRITLEDNLVIAKTATGAEKSAIKIDKGSLINVVHNQMDGPWYNGLYVDGLQESFIEDNYAKAINYGMNITSDLQSTKNIHIKNNTLNGGTADIRLAYKTSCTDDIINVYMTKNIYINQRRLNIGNCGINGAVDVDIVNNGADGVPTSFSYYPKWVSDEIHALIVCNDKTDGCILKIQKTNGDLTLDIKRGDKLKITNMSLPSVTIPTVPGVVRIRGGGNITLAQYESLDCAFEGGSIACN